MEKFNKKVEVIYNYIKRSESATPYAYEVSVKGADGITEIVSRTQGSSSFKADMEEAYQTALQMKGTLEVRVYGGMSNNALLKNSYPISVSDVPRLENSNNPDDLEEKIKRVVASMQPQPQNTGTQGLGALDSLVGALSGNSPSGDGLAGLVGLATQMASQSSNEAILKNAHQLEIFKKDTAYQNLVQRYNPLVRKYKNLVSTHNATKAEVVELQREVAELQEELAANAPRKLGERTLIGIGTKIGSNLLANSKFSDLLGIDDNEFKSALGIIDDNKEDNDAKKVESAPVSIQAVEEQPLEVALSPEDKAKKEAIDEIVNTLKNLQPTLVARLYEMICVILSSEAAFDHFESIIADLNKQVSTMNGTEDLNDEEIPESDDETIELVED